MQGIEPAICLGVPAVACSGSAVRPEAGHPGEPEGGGKLGLHNDMIISYRNLRLIVLERISLCHGSGPGEWR